MIGKNAVDPVTGDLSPIIGVRISPETQTVVPVTLSSGAHKKRKPPLGAVTMLEDEIVARKSFWRRQRQREAELTLQEFDLCQKILYNINSIKARKLTETLEALAEKARGLNEAARREVQRRSEAEQEFSAVLPPDVCAILTEGDEAERKAEEVHIKSHGKLSEMIQKFFTKLQTEDDR